MSTEQARVEAARKAKTAFDRWLAGVKAQAWDEGFDAGRDDLGAAQVAIEHGEDKNPYRGGREDD